MSDHIPNAGEMGTPYTDAAQFTLGDGPAKYVYAAFAAGLERELAETRGWIRKHPPMLDGFYHIAECDCSDCFEWRKAAGLRDEQ